MTQRTRMKNIGSIPLTIEVYDQPPGAIVETHNWGAQNSYQSITDVSTPGYADLKRRGVVIMSPATIEKSEYSGSTDTLVAYGPPAWGSRRWTGIFVPALVPDAGEQSNTAGDVAIATQNVINEVYAKAYNGAAQLGVTIAEGNKTLQMIRKPFGRARNILEQMLYRKMSLINKGMSSVQAITNTWLEYRLGWKPVIYDIHNIMDAVGQQFAGNRTTERQVARASKTIESFVEQETALVPQLRFNEGRGRSTKSVSYRVSAGVLYETVLQSETGLLSDRTRHNFGLQLRDVARTGWELIPFSFVVDRFVDVGTWLEAIQPNPSVRILGSWSSVKRSARSQRQILYLKVNTTPPAFTGPSGMFSGTNLMLTRSVGVTPSIIPMLNIGSLSLSQHADHLSLLMNKLLSFRRKS